MAWRSLPNLYDTRWMRTCGKDLNRMSQRRCALTNCQFFAGFCGLSIFVRTFVVRNAVDQNSQNERVSLILRGHLKSGQWWSLQNRPTECGLGLGCFTPTPRVEARLFSCANSVDRICAQ